MAVPRPSQAVDDFVDRTVAPAGDHELTPFVTGAPGDFDGFAGCGGLRKIGLDAARAEDPASFVELSAAGGVSSAGVRVMNQ